MSGNPAGQCEGCAALGEEVDELRRQLTELFDAVQMFSAMAQAAKLQLAKADA